MPSSDERREVHVPCVVCPRLEQPERRRLSPDLTEVLLMLKCKMYMNNHTRLMYNTR